MEYKMYHRSLRMTLGNMMDPVIQPRAHITIQANWELKAEGRSAPIITWV